MPALIGIFSANSAPFRNELKIVEQAAASSANKIEQTAGEAAAKSLPNATAMREALVLMREISSGSWTRVPGSLSLLIDRLGFLKYLLTPMVGLLSLIGAGVAYLAFHFKNLADSLDNANNIFNRFHTTVSAASEAMQSLADATQRFAKFWEEINQPQDTVMSDAEDRLKNMREEFALQERIAKAKERAQEEAATTPEARQALQRQAAQREHDARVKQAQDEMAFLGREATKADVAYRIQEQALKKQQADYLANAKGPKGEEYVREKEADLEKMKQTADALRRDAEKNPGKVGPSGRFEPVIENGKPLLDYRGVPVLRDPNINASGFYRERTPAEAMAATRTVKLGGEKVTMSADAARLAVEEATNDLIKAKAGLNQDDIRKAQSNLAKAKEEKERLTRMTDDAAAAVDRAKREPLELSAAAERQQRLHLERGRINELQSVGAYAPAASMGILESSRQTAHNTGQMVRLMQIRHRGNSPRAGSEEVAGARF